jgi:hypothetical protein
VCVFYDDTREAAVDMATEPDPGEALPSTAIKQPRAYQLELFDASMKRNVIVTVRH